MKPVPRQVRTLFISIVLTFATIASGLVLQGAEPDSAAATAAKKYTATAYLLVERHEPHILPHSAEKDDLADFESYRATQMQLIKSQFVLIAALRNPKVQKQPSIKREEDRHHSLAWLGKEICVKSHDERTGVLTVSLTSGDPQEAAALVNAVVEAYMNEVVNNERQQRRERLSDLQQISAEKENEVRTKKEQLKRELENCGIAASDDQAMAVRRQLAASLYLDFQRDFQRMRAEHRVLIGKLKEATMALAALPNQEISPIQVAAVLNNNPVYRDIQNRLWVLQKLDRQHVAALPPGTKPRPKDVRTKVDLEAANSQLQAMEQQSLDQVRGALRMELENAVHRLECQVEVSTGQLAVFEKEVEKKASEADDISRSSVSAQLARADVDDLERIYRALAAERETLRVELTARSRVSVLGDRNAPAAVPESPD